jgi:hypothetical protein
MLLSPPRAALAAAATVLTCLATLLLSGTALAQDTTLPTDGVSGLDSQSTTPIAAEIWALESIGDTVWAGGGFLEVVDRSSGARIDHPYLAAFDARTGEYVPTLLTTPNGPVYDIGDLGDGRMLIAGEFTAVNGVANTGGLAIVHTNTGKVDTTFRASINGGGDFAVRSVDIDGGWVYAVGSFTGIRGGSSATLHAAGRAARLSLATGAVDTSWTPTLQGGGGWGVAVSGGSRVHIGGYFTSANNTAATEALATFDTASGALVGGWNHGLPWNLSLNWSTIGGAVNDLDVSGDLVFIGGAKHAYAVMQASTGAVVRVGSTTNDAQTVEIQNGRVYVGCHCSSRLEWTQVLDANTGAEISTLDAAALRGAAGTWASTVDRYGCVWHGGNFSSQVVNGARTAVHNLGRTCVSAPPAGARPAPALSGDPAPAVPGQPTVVSQHGNSITISWSALGNTQQLRYQILRNGVPVGVSGGTTYTDAFLPPGGHDWQVQAISLDGEAGPLSPRSSRIALGASVNVAPAGSAYGPGDAPLPEAIDSSLAVPAAEDFVEIDLGRQVPIDTIEILGENLSRARVIVASQPIVSDVLVEAQLEPHRTMRLVASPEFSSVLPVASTARWIRVQRTGTATVKVAEVRVFSTGAFANTAARTADTTPPAAPRWAAKSAYADAGSLYRWGGDTDNTAVAYYELYRDGQFVGRRATSVAGGANSALPTSVNGVVAFDADGNASANLPTGPPAAPTTCTTQLVDDAIELAVQRAPNAPDAAVIIYRSRNGGPWSWAARLAPGGPSTWTNTTISVGNTYAYRVVASSAEGVSDPTGCGDPIDVESSDDSAVAPTACTTSNVDTGLFVSWTRATNDNATAVIVFRSRNGGPWSWAARVEGATTTFTNTSVVAGSSYAYRVVAQNRLGNSEPTTCGDAVEPVPPTLAAPATCTRSANGAISVSFTPATNDGATAYVVQRKRDGGDWWWAARLDPATTQWTDANASSGTRYRYRVYAVAGNSTSPTTICGAWVTAP